MTGGTGYDALVTHVFAHTAGPDEHDVSNGDKCWCNPKVSTFPSSARTGPARTVIDHGDLPHPEIQRVEKPDSPLVQCPWCDVRAHPFGLSSHLRAKHAIRGVA